MAVLNLALSPVAVTIKPAIASPPGTGSTFKRPARNGASCDQQHVEQKLDPVLDEQLPRQVPDHAGLTVFKQPAGGLFGIAKIDLRAG